MKKILSVMLILSTLGSTAQKTANPTPYAKTITAADLSRHLYIIAGKDMEGRETATRGQRRAAAYIETQFKNIGLEAGNNGSYQMKYPVYQDSLVIAAFEVNGKAFQLDKDFNPFPTAIPATMKFSEIVFIGAEAIDSLKNKNLAGKLVLVIRGNQQQGRNQGAAVSALLDKGVAGILVVFSNYPRSASNRNGSQSLSQFRSSIAPQQFSISENLAQVITGGDFNSIKSNTGAIKTYKADILLEVKKVTTILQSSNVLGMISGTDLKDE